MTAFGKMRISGCKKKNDFYRVKAVVVDFDRDNDLALVKVDNYLNGKTLEQLKEDVLIPERRGGQSTNWVAKIYSATPKVGTVYAMGYPKSNPYTVTAGLNNGYMNDSKFPLLNLAMPINRGMSGGPLKNINSEVVGVTVLKGGDSTDSMGYGVPGSSLQIFINDFMNNKYDKQAKLGLVGMNDLETTVSKEKGHKDFINSFRLAEGRTSIGNWMISKTPDILSCTFSEKYNYNKSRKKRDLPNYQLLYKQCWPDSFKISRALLRDLGTRSFKLLYTNIQTKRFVLAKRHFNVLSNYHNSAGVRGLAREIDEDVLKSRGCSSYKFVNENNIPFIVDYCSHLTIHERDNILRRKRGTSDLLFRHDLKVSTLLNDDDNLQLKLKFSATNNEFQEIVKKLLSEISYGKVPTGNYKKMYLESYVAN